MNLFLLFLLLPFLAFSAGGPITNNRYTTSILGGGSSGGSLVAAYGQLYLSASQEVPLTSDNTWVAIPFNAFGPSSNVSGSTTSPASLTIQQGGVYQINVSVYFSSENSPEDTFTQTTYTLGVGMNRTVVAHAAVYAAEAGGFSLNYSALSEFSTGDSLQFYIQASNVGGGEPFQNIVTMLQANAALVQIAE